MKMYAKNWDAIKLDICAYIHIHIYIYIYISVGLWCEIQTSINENINNDIEDYTKYGLFLKVFGLMLSYPQYSKHAHCHI